MKPRNLLTLLMFIALLNACGGSSDSKDGGTGGDTLVDLGGNNQECGTFDEPLKKTGTLKSLEGIAFSSEIVDATGIKKTLTGITGADGSYEFYSSCDTSSVTTFCLGIKKNCSVDAFATGVLISQGGGIIGSITSTENAISVKDVVSSTYQDATEAEIEAVTTNVYQLLLSLDEDADSTNGIAISESSRDEAELVASGIDFTDSGFDTNQSVVQLVATVDADGVLATEAEAQAFDAATVNTVGFTESMLAGKVYLLDVFGSDMERITFDATGNTGTFKFAPHEENNFNNFDIDVITWWIEDGKLIFLEPINEGTDTVQWEFTPTNINGGVITFDRAASDGQETMQFPGVNTMTFDSENENSGSTENTAANDASLSSQLLSGKVFSVSVEGSDAESLSFNNDGTGTIRFSPNPDNNFDTNDVNLIENWQVNSGVLTFREIEEDGNDYWDFSIEATSIANGVISFNISSTNNLGLTSSSSGTMEELN